MLQRLNALLTFLGLPMTRAIPLRSRLGKTDKMPPAHPFGASWAPSNHGFEYKTERTIEYYELELFERKLEETRLRLALAHAENRLLQWERPCPGRSTSPFENRDEAANRIANLTPRELEIMELVLAVHPSKNIAADLGISRRTVENYRAAIMKKTGSALPALGRFGLTFSRSGPKQRVLNANRRLPGLPLGGNTIIAPRV
jgi:DNA-binding CsgD family transcriptional regulator